MHDTARVDTGEHTKFYIFVLLVWILFKKMWRNF